MTVIGRRGRLSTLAGVLALLAATVTSPPAHGRDPYQSRRIFMLLHGGIAPADGLLLTAPKNGPLGRSRSTMTDEILLTYSIAVLSRFSQTEQVFHGSARNLDTVEKRNVRIEVLRTPMSGINAGRAEVARVVSLGHMLPQAARAINLRVTARNTRSLDWRIRIVHD